MALNGAEKNVSMASDLFFEEQQEYCNMEKNRFDIDWGEFEREWIHRHSGQADLLFDTAVTPLAETFSPIDGLLGFEFPEDEQSSFHYTDIDRLLNEESESVWCKSMLQLDKINWEWKVFEDEVMKEDQVLVDDLREQPQATVSNETITREQHQNTANIQSDNQIFNTICTEDMFHREDHKGLRIVHLLVACAEAVAGDAMDLAQVILHRLRGLVCASGSSIERVGYYLSHALRSYAVGHMELMDLTLLHSMKCSNYNAVLLGAFRVLFEVYPYIRFAHFMANHVLLETLIKKKEKENTKKIHIIDFDIMEGLQWPPFMEALTHHMEPPLQLRITALKWTDVDFGSISSMEDTARRLSDVATSTEGIQSFAFQQVQLEDLERHLRDNGEDESVIINCMWELPHMTCRRRISDLSQFLHCARLLRPAILTLADGAFQSSGRTAPDLATRLCESLHHFGAVFDSLEARLPRQGVATALVERIFFCSKVESSIIMLPPPDHPPNETSLPDLMVECGLVKKKGFAEDGLLHARALLQIYNDSSGGLFEVDLVNDVAILKWGLNPLVYTSMWEFI